MEEEGGREPERKKVKTLQHIVIEEVIGRMTWKETAFVTSAVESRRDTLKAAAYCKAVEIAAVDAVEKWGDDKVFSGELSTLTGVVQDRQEYYIFTCNGIRYNVVQMGNRTCVRRMGEPEFTIGYDVFTGVGNVVKCQSVLLSPGIRDFVVHGKDVSNHTVQQLDSKVIGFILYWRSYESEIRKLKEQIMCDGWKV